MAAHSYLELTIVQDGHLVTAAHEGKLVGDEDGGTLVEGSLDCIGEHVFRSVVVHSPARQTTSHTLATD